MEIYSIGNIPLGSFPYPYEFLMGVGFYFYIRSQILLPEKSNFIKKHCYVFIPAVLYGISLLTCYVILIKEGNSDIIRDIEATGFYTTIEFIRFTFNLLLGYTAITFL
ncbi:MAG: hypothetical protein OIF32_08955, partial [Campylobacterales bacterium]|nr:hypothetical protein [Campylobacterales bacterium]